MKQSDSASRLRRDHASPLVIHQEKVISSKNVICWFGGLVVWWLWWFGDLVICWFGDDPEHDIDDGHNSQWCSQWHAVKCQLSFWEFRMNGLWQTLVLGEGQVYKKTIFVVWNILQSEDANEWMFWDGWVLNQSRQKAADRRNNKKADIQFRARWRRWRRWRRSSGDEYDGERIWTMEWWIWQQRWIWQQKWTWWQQK